jgi:hypothetical protein
MFDLMNFARTDRFFIFELKENYLIKATVCSSYLFDDKNVPINGKIM